MGLLDTVLGKVFSPGIITPTDAELAKGWKKLPDIPAAREPKAMLWDPMSLVHSLGYKDRRSNLTYDILRQMSGSLSILAAIINTRVNQVATFTSPYRRTRNIGFEIKHKDRDHKLTASEKRFIVELEEFVSGCGKKKNNKYSTKPRDNFEQFTRKVIRDRMTYDQLTFETVPDRKGTPYEFIAVDAATIRLAADRHSEKNRNRKEENRHLRDFMDTYSGSVMEYPMMEDGPRKGSAAYVQVWQGSIIRAYEYSELAFCIANPRTDIRANGYGLAETEQLINIITSHLWTEEYNRNFFKQGSVPKGLLNVRGDNIAPEQLENFKRQWSANVAGSANAYKMPILQSEEVQYINMQANNLDMEYSRWLDYLLKTICAVFLIAPEEVGFDLSTGGMQQPGFDTNNEWKLKASKDRGLRPLLRFYADAINRHVIDLIDDNFYLDFVGLDELTEKERIELRNQQVQYFRTVNEIRADEDLSPIADGDLILNPIYLQSIQMDHQQKVEAEQRKEQKKAQEEQLQMQKQQMAQQQQAQEQQVAMQQQQLAGAGQEGAPQEEQPMPTFEEQLAAEHQQQSEQPPQGAEAAPAPQEEAAAPPQEAAPEGGEMSPPQESAEMTPQEVPSEEPPKSKKDQLQELINSLPPGMLSNNTKGIGEE